MLSSLLTHSTIIILSYGANEEWTNNWHLVTSLTLSPFMLLISILLGQPIQFWVFQVNQSIFPLHSILIQFAWKLLANFLLNQPFKSLVTESISVFHLLPLVILTWLSLNKAIDNSHNIPWIVQLYFLFILDLTFFHQLFKNLPILSWQVMTVINHLLLFLSFWDDLNLKFGNLNPVITTWSHLCH